MAALAGPQPPMAWCIRRVARGESLHSLASPRPLTPHPTPLQLYVKIKAGECDVQDAPDADRKRAAYMITCLNRLSARSSDWEPVALAALMQHRMGHMDAGDLVVLLQDLERLSWMWALCGVNARVRKQRTLKVRGPGAPGWRARLPTHPAARVPPATAGVNVRGKPVPDPTPRPLPGRARRSGANVAGIAVRRVRAPGMHHLHGPACLFGAIESGVSAAIVGDRKPIQAPLVVQQRPTASIRAWVCLLTGAARARAGRRSSCAGGGVIRPAVAPADPAHHQGDRAIPGADAG